MFVQPSPPVEAPSLSGALEDIIPPASRAGSMAPQSEILECDLPRDPFKDLEVHGFSLPAVGAALSVRPSNEGPSEWETLPWSIVTTGGEGLTRPRRIPRDKREKLYCQEKSLFATPVWPSTLPVNPGVEEEDRLLRDLQSQWGILGLMVSCSILHLEATLK